MIIKIYKNSLKIKGENEHEISELNNTFDSLEDNWTDEIEMEPDQLYGLLYDLTLNFNIRLQ